MLHGSNNIVKVADGRSHEVLGVVRLPVVFDTVVLPVEFWVVPSLPHEVILGIDFCKIFQVVVDHHARTANSKLRGVAGSSELKNSVLVKSSEVDECVVDEALISENFLKGYQLDALNSVVAKYKSTLGREGLGCTDLYEHKIETGDASPERTRYYSYAPKMLKIMQEGVDEYEKMGIVEKSSSPWCSPVILLPKPDGSYRWVVNLKKLNKKAKFDSYTPYKVNDIVDHLRDAKYLTSIDLRSAYFQIPLEKHSREKTAFMVPGRGLYQFTRLPQGLNSSSAAWQRFIDRVVGHDLQPYCFVYLDDLILVSSDFDEHLKLIDTVLGRLEKANLTVNFDKSKFCRAELRFLGYLVDERGLRVCEDKVKAIEEFPRPKSVKQVRQFVGLAGWYRRF